MKPLQLVMAPSPIFKSKAAQVLEVNDEIRQLMDSLLDTIYYEQAVGIAATMVGILKRVVVIDLQVNGEKAPLFMANPEIIESSNTTQTFSEGSLCFPGITADITRPAQIKAKYIDYNNNPQTIDADGFLSTCIQHEIDYLNGKIFLDYLTGVKKDVLLRKMQKYKKKFENHHHHHVHSESCNH